MQASGLDFQLWFESSPDILLVLRPDSPRFTMVGATRSRLEITQVTLAQTVGRGLFEAFPDNPDDPDATGVANLRASLERVLATRAPDTMPVQKYDVRAPDGSYQVRYWSPKNLPVITASGELAYILHRVEDVTELVQASEAGQELRDRTKAMEREVIKRGQELHAANLELRAANDKLGRLDAAKTTFFSNVSHELRTPLTLLLGPLEDSLSDVADALTPAHRPRVEMAHASAVRLLGLVNAVLDFTRIEAGRMTAQFAPLDLARATAELAGMFQSAVTRAGLRLEVDCPPLSQPIWVDRGMWDKIVPNLLSNAFKFTLAGSITVRVREAPRSAVLEVTDTGVGIPADELPRVFERFHRVPGGAGRTQEGTGIGLSLVRELVNLHGGRVSVDSVQGRGTTFRVELPKGQAHLPAAWVSQTAVQATLEPTAASHATAAGRWAPARAPGPNAKKPKVSLDGQPAPRRAQILVIDDNADLRTYIAGLLAPTYDVSLAEDGVAGLEAVRASPPDLVLSDVMMPRLDGFGLLRELRGDPATLSLPVILLSARAGEESSIDGLDAGADDYLVKPFSARELLARVRTHLQLTRARREWLAELERANRELEAFSYSVSHDLRAPLRAIDGFTNLLLREYGAGFDAQARHYLERVRTAAARMSALIDDLLELSRVGRTPLALEETDLTALAQATVAELALREPERKVVVDLAPGLTAQADRRLIAILLENLVGNAWKFTSKTAAARIAVGREERAGRSVFFVRDNGAGFDMAYADKLFRPFQRLHTESEFEGTGVGLATVQRVMARHGGEIWAEGAPGRGAVFFFSFSRGVTRDG